MASATDLPDAMETSGFSSKDIAPPGPLTGQSQSHLSLGITLLLFLWPSLTLAVTNQWGGPSSSDKREWFAQTTIDVLAATPDADAEWIEAFLLQVMLDEFEVSVEDDSAWEVAEGIVRLRRDCARGDFVEVRALWTVWEARKQGREEEGRELGRLFRGKEVVEHGGEEGDEDEESGSEDGDEDEDGDVEMDEAPTLVRVKEKVAPEVDEEGFTKVTKKKR